MEVDRIYIGKMIKPHHEASANLKFRREKESKIKEYIAPTIGKRHKKDE